MEKPQDLFGQCPYVTAQRIFSGKWAILIIHHLRGGTLRFGQLQRRLGGITQATLTKQLRELEGYGLIQRRVYAQVPPKVEYSLSPIGEAFLPVLDQFEVFGNRYIDYLNRQGPQGDSCHLNQV
ncbi:MAG: winged helix-turn-helix transcriptional regulator [Christensenellales bacterium]